MINSSDIFGCWGIPRYLNMWIALAQEKIGVSETQSDEGGSAVDSRRCLFAAKHRFAHSGYGFAHLPLRLLKLYVAQHICDVFPKKAITVSKHLTCLQQKIYSLVSDISTINTLTVSRVIWIGVWCPTIGLRWIIIPCIGFYHVLHRICK